ncbi:MAG: TFIIB-type zinc ribbon-containing protein [Candidatus Omnitrophica bacterium]|nr:TFIIB-type zinc ribbon-containing protein [Candidatus Omnitrophota bacterium]
MNTNQNTNQYVCEDCKCTLVINTKTGEITCTECGLVQGRIYETIENNFDEGILKDTTHNSLTPDFVIGSKNLAAKINLKKVNPLYLTIEGKDNKRLKHYMSILNDIETYNIFHFNKESKSQIIQLALQIKRFTDQNNKNEPYINIIVMALIFFLRSRQVPFIVYKGHIVPTTINKITKVLNQQLNYDLKPKYLLRTLQKMPKSFQSRFKQPSIYACMVYIINFLFSTPGHFKLDQLYLYQLKEFLVRNTLKYNHVSNLPTTTTLHVALKIIIQLIKQFETIHKISSCISIKKIAKTFNISELTIRTVKIGDMNS